MGVGGQCHAPHPQEKDPTRIVYEAGWAAEPVLMDAEILHHTGIQSRDHPTYSELLCQLHYPGNTKMYT